MAGTPKTITITNEPTQLNTVYTKLLYSVVSTDPSKPQFKYVCDIEDYNGNLIQRIKQPANETGHAIFNVAVPIRPQLKVDDTLYIQEPTASLGYGDNPINSYKQFIVKFGEEYGTSPSSSVTIYNGNGVIGEPAVTGTILSLGRMEWEPWSNSFFNSSSAEPPYSTSETGSVNYWYNEIDPSGKYAATASLFIDGVSALQSYGSGSLTYYDNPGEYYFEVKIPGNNNLKHRYSLDIYNMSDQVSVYSSGYVQASASFSQQTVISQSFTGSLGDLYGVRLNAIYTSSAEFTPPPLDAYYLASDYTASSWRVSSGQYPLFPGNVINVSNQDSSTPYEVQVNSTSGAVIGQALEAYPTLEDFSVGEIPFIPPSPTGSFQSWNWNAQDIRVNWTGSNPSYTGFNKTKTILTNWPQYQLEQLSQDRTFDNLAINGENRFRGVSENDLGIVSWFNISGSIDVTDTTDRAYGVSLYYFSPESSSLETGQANSQVKFTGPALNTLSPALVSSGSGADIPFCSGPLFPANLPGLNTSVEWNFLKLQINQSSINWWKRDEPCPWETRSNFAFINKWGVWDFIGLNTTTNKNAVISKRDEFMSVNVDYNASTPSYSPYNRGFEQYYLSQDYKYEITTDYIAGVNSQLAGDFSIENFYQELFQSPNVMLQVDDTFIPINLTNSSFTYKTNKKGQKKYQVKIQYEFSNKPRSRT